jgi:alpha,alpha-trehalose phosphorylase
VITQDLEDLAQTESLFALSNGHIGVRGNLDEGDPHGLPGTYLNSFCENYPLPYAESGYGYPESSEWIVNVTNGKLIRLLVDDEPFDLRYGQVLRHERCLDLREGVLRRTVQWTSPAGLTIEVRTRRLVSFTQRAIVAIDYEVEILSDIAADVVVQSELVANEEIPTVHTSDPRSGRGGAVRLQALEHGGEQARAWLAHATERSDLRVTAAMDHLYSAASPGHQQETELVVEADQARFTLARRLGPGEILRLTKFIAYGWSGVRTLPALRDQVEAALTVALTTGWQGLVRDQRAQLEAFWSHADVEIEGDPAIQQAVRFGLFHLYQAAIRAEGRGIPAKGLTGSGYDGHAFWDTEMFVLPMLTAAVPQAVAHALEWRHSILPLAKSRAEALGWRGAAFPWRTIRGQECSGYWPASTAALHLNADVAAAALRLVRWTGDAEFEQRHALPLLIETARLWMSFGYQGADNRFHVDGVTGPDEYSALGNDNTYTNLMAKANLVGAIDTVERHRLSAEEFEVTEAELQAWRAAAEAMAIPRDADGIPEQAQGFNSRKQWPFVDADVYPLMQHAHYLDLYRHQVVKQADLMLAMHWCGDAFTAEEKASAFGHYEPITVRDSSLSASTQSILAAEVGHLQLAHDYLTEAAFIDLHDEEHNTRDGLHIAALAGTWLATVAGFGGMRDHGGRLSFRPQLPPTISRITFAVLWRAAILRVTITPDTAEYTVEAEDEETEVRIVHNGEEIVVRAKHPVVMPVELVQPLTPQPGQPPLREPPMRPSKTESKPRI